MQKKKKRLVCTKVPDYWKREGRARLENVLKRAHALFADRENLLNQMEAVLDDIQKPKRRAVIVSKDTKSGPGLHPDVKNVGAGTETNNPTLKVGKAPTIRRKRGCLTGS